jgi:hypothetical protein
MVVTLNKKLVTSLSNAFGDNFQDIEEKKLLPMLSMDPQTSNIDIFVIDTDFFKQTITQKKALKAFSVMHPDVICAVLVTPGSDKVLNKVPDQPNIHKARFGKGDNIKDVVEGVYSAVVEAESSSSERISSEDIIPDSLANIPEVEGTAPVPEPVDENLGVPPLPESNPSIPEPVDIPDDIPAPTINVDVEADAFVVPEPEDVKHDPDFSQPTTAKVQSAADYKTLEEIAKDLDKNRIYSELIRNNTAYQDVTRKLSILDKQILELHKDPNLSADQRLKAMQEVISDKAALKGASNSIIVDYICSIFDNVTDVATVMMDDEIQKIRRRMKSVSERELYKGNQEVISRLLDERYNVQLELSNILRQISDLFGTMTQLATDTTSVYIEGVPTSNPYINNYLKPMQKSAPMDLAQHTEKLFEHLNEKRLTFSAVEAHVRALMQAAAKLIDYDDEIVSVQQELIDTMRVQKIEDVVIVTSMLKNVMRVYAGGPMSGKTAAVAVISDIHNRKGNTLTIDLTGKNKLSTYINGMHKVEDVMHTTNNGMYPYLYSDVPLALNYEEFFNYLTECSQYYRFIDVIVEDEKVLQKVQREALSFTVFMEPNISSINNAKKLIDALTVDNIAKQICVVNPSVEPTEMFSLLDIQPTVYKYIAIPNMPEITKCALRNANPGQVKEIRAIYEEQFN